MAYSRSLIKAALEETKRRVEVRETDKINPPKKHDYELRMFDEAKINRFYEHIEELEHLRPFWNDVVKEFEIANGGMDEP